MYTKSDSKLKLYVLVGLVLCLIKSIIPLFILTLFVLITNRDTKIKKALLQLLAFNIIYQSSIDIIYYVNEVIWFTNKVAFYMLDKIIQVGFIVIIIKLVINTIEGQELTIPIINEGIEALYQTDNAFKGKK